MKINGEDKRAFWWKNNSIHFIDQRKLPYKLEMYIAKTVDDCAHAIKDMIVRGAPAIGAAAAYGIVLGKIYGPAPAPMEIWAGFAVALAFGVGAAVVMILRKKME